MEHYDLQKYLLPVWEGDTVYFETALMVGEEDLAPLLYPVKELIGVYNYGLEIEYKRGVDYQVVDGKIKRLKGGNLPYMPIDEYYLEEQAQYAIAIVNRNEKAPEGKKFFSFGEKDSYSKYQIAVSYRHEGKTHIKAPLDKSARLNNFIKKLKGGKADIIFYGDSITTGCNISGTPQGGETAPYAEKFSVMVCRALREKFGAVVGHRNTAVGGWSTVEGLNAFNEKVTNLPADLMVLGFGMNDGRAEPKDYLDRTEQMVKLYKEKNPDGEVILIATTLPNTESDWVRNQPLFAAELYKLEQKYPFVAVADMTDMHKNLLATGKRYRDMTGNNVNHPNDFLGRIYAQVLLKTILG